jgi:hypothetical protein
MTYVPHIEVAPLSDATPGQLDRVRTSRWCWGIAHYEEYLNNLRWFLTHVPEHHDGLHVVHRHKYAEICNESCKLVIADVGPKPGGGVVI